VLEKITIVKLENKKREIMYKFEEKKEDDEDKKESPLAELIAKSFLDKRIVSLYGEVNNEIAAATCDQLMYLDSLETNKDIILFLNSPGGSVTDGMDIYDTMQIISSDVVTVGRGMVASMGQFLLTAGTAGKRFVLPHTRVLMHQPSGGIGGTASDIRIEVELITKMREELSTITAERTGKTVDQINEDNEYDHWFTAEEAVEYGFADKILTNLKELNINSGTNIKEKK
jgi:ATP-dependent Clp protease protease subunit